MKPLLVHILLSVSTIYFNPKSPQLILMIFCLGRDFIPFDSLEEFLDSEYTLAVEGETFIQYNYQKASEGTIER